MKMAALLYHDVVGQPGFQESGFPGGDANAYKFSDAEFAEHMRCVHARTSGRGVDIFAALAGKAGGRDFLLTFDDGGVGAIRYTADILERYDSRGHFFITSDYIGTNGFLGRPEIAELHRRGHVIGSHSRSHPPVISRCTRAELLSEWGDSVRALSDITGAAVTTASVPGGFYSGEVADTAIAAGIRILFTSEPTARVRRRGECSLIGRYSVQRGTTPAAAAALAACDPAATARQAVYWNAKKLLKTAGGRYWLWFRKAVLARRYDR